MINVIDFKKYRSILCLNGDLPKYCYFQHGLPVIAADGAANTLMQMGITPQLVIGDLDSIKPEYLSKLKSYHHFDQDYSDFQKALMYMREHNLLPAIIFGVNGGYLDHVLNNINHFISTDSILFSPPIYGFTLSSGQTKTLYFPSKTKISIFGIPVANVSSVGLQWELQHVALSFPGHNSCFNRTVLDTVELCVHQGCALVLAYIKFTA